MTKRAQQFECLAAGIMDAGSPIATGYVRFYEAGTTTLKNAYADKDKGSSFTKLALDADSRGVAYGDGIYKLKFYAGDPDNGGTDTGITIDNYKCTAVLGAIRTVTSADDIDRDDELVMVDTTSGNITVTLEDVDTFDNPVTIKKIAAGNTVTIATTDSQTIDGDSTATLTGNNQTLTLFPDQSADVWRKSNDQTVDNISDLTATASEINTACDGITATAAEINTACDGVTATASEINTACDGITATASEINTACDGVTATATEINSGCDGMGVTIPRIKVIEMGTWDMDGNDALAVAHGLTAAKIVSVVARVVNDNASQYYDLAGDVYGSIQFNDTNIICTRTTSGNFDDVAFDSTASNRGYIVIFYID
jgi:hypothetical protein